MLTFIELLIGVVVIVGVARYIIKGYSATGVLFVGGLLLLIISAIMGHKVLPSSQASTGYSATDIVEYVKILLMSRGGDLGMMIMMLCGFAAYMTHIGANYKNPLLIQSITPSTLRSQVPPHQNM